MADDGTAGVGGEGGDAVARLRAQVRELQEQVSFGDHASDQLSAELLRAFEAIRAISARLDRIEARLEDVVAHAEEAAGGAVDGEAGPLDGIELPPHSMGDRAQRARDIAESDS